MQNTQNLVPKKIRALAWLLVVMGIGIGLAGYLKPDVLIPGFMANSVANNTISMMFTGRNLAMGLGMLLVLLWGMPVGFLLIFALRFMIELADLTATLANATSLSAALPMIIFIGVFLVLEAYAIMTIWKIVQNKPQKPK